MVKETFSRRQFMHISAAAGAGLALGGGTVLSAEGDLEKRNLQTGTMSYAPLGRTKMLVSRLGIGGLPWNSDVARSVIERGCNLIHGSMKYENGQSVINQGTALKGQWDKVFYLLKGDVSDENVDSALKALGRDHVDMILPVFGSTRGVADPGIRERFERMKKAGKVRFLGLTVHTKEPPEAVVEEAVKAGFYDAVLTMYQPARLRTLIPALKKARGAGMGTIAMKSLQGVKGGLEDQAKVLGAAWSKGEIDTVLKGLKNFDQAKALAAAAQRQKSAWLHRPLPQDEIVQMADRSVCGACGACARACQAGLDLPEIMRCMTYYAPEVPDHACQAYREIPARLTAASCKDCGRCERACPRGLPIRTMIREAHHLWA